jgi:hypothetical protein
MKSYFTIDYFVKLVCRYAILEGLRPSNSDPALRCGCGEVFFRLQFLEVIGDFFALHALTVKGALQIQAAVEHLQLGAARALQFVKAGALHRPVIFNDDGNFISDGPTIKGTGGYFPITHNFMTSNSKLQNPNSKLNAGFL